MNSSFSQLDKTIKQIPLPKQGGSVPSTAAPEPPKQMPLPMIPVLWVTVQDIAAFVCVFKPIQVLLVLKGSGVKQHKQRWFADRSNPLMNSV